MQTIRFFLICTFFYIFSIQGMENRDARKLIYDPKNTALLVSAGVMSKSDSSFVKILTNITRGLGTLSLDMIKATARAKTLGQEAAQKINGTGNIIHYVLDTLKEENYGDFSQKESDITKLSVLRKPRADVIAAFSEIKNEGYQIYLTDGGDSLQNRYLREQLNKEGIAVDSLFSGIFTYNLYNDNKRCKREADHFYELTDEAAATDVPVYSSKFTKDNPKYFNVVKSIVPSQNMIVFEKEFSYIQAAQQAIPSVEVYQFVEADKKQKAKNPEQLLSKVNKVKSGAEIKQILTKKFAETYNPNMNEID